MILKRLLPVGALVMVGSAALSQAPAGQQARSLAATIAAMPKNLPRGAAPGVEEAIRAARASQARCAQKGAKISVLVADAQGRPVVLLSGDGAGYRSALIAQTKANIVARWHVPSIEVANRAAKDPALAAQAAADPDIGMLRGGGLPVVRQGVLVGIVAVSGASLEGGDLTLDETCARAAVASLETP